MFCKLLKRTANKNVSFNFIKTCCVQLNFEDTLKSERLSDMDCVVSKSIHTPPTDDHWKLLVVGGGGGVLKAKLLEEKNFLGGEVRLHIQVPLP